ncbi:hypothetical protein Sste5346_003072 [Sporothrix stenoceras]|uniref:DNA replication regulator SLD2 n=1 Tax=Sporothrix stenoceras TaxID=5173 RepID=A0ABR3ZFI2_9PEZI
MTLDATERATYEAESQQLRVELKTWETTWAREHGGAKPAREDISKNPDIAKKYKAYNHTRAVLSGKVSTKSDAKKDEARRKRKQSTAAALADTDSTQLMQTPSKRMRATVTRATPSRAPAATPTQGGASYLDAHLNMTPSISRKLFSPVVPTSIGPTPQRDGRVLGLFDVLNEEEEKRKKRNSIAATPSKRAAAEAEAAAAAAAQGAGNLAVPSSTALLDATPRKQTLNIHHYKSDDEEDEESTVNARRLGRTPMSSGRRNLLNHFTAGGNIPAAFTTGSETKTRDSSGVLGTTPLKPRNNDNQNYMTQQLLTTPSKGSGNNSTHPFATPAFLRRTSSALPPVDENGEFMSPPNKLRLPRKPLVRGLSSVLASLRKAEDEQLDEQLDVLRDLENSMDMKAPPPLSKPKPKATTSAVASTAPAPQKTLDNGVQVEDSQLQDPHEQELQELEQYEQELGPDDEQQRPRLLGGFDDEGLYDSDPEEQVGRDGQPLRVYKKKGQKRTTRRFNIRPTRTKRPVPGTMPDEASGSEDDENEVEGGSLAPLSSSEFGSDAEDGPGKVRTTKKAADKKTTEKKTDGPVKKAVRKVNELAHANFKRLKLRNHGSKGGPGFNSRFRRKR